MEEVPEYGDWIAEIIEPYLKGSVLEVGCGYGMYSSAYASLPNVTSVIAIDLSADAITAAERKTHPMNVVFRKQDVFEMTETFDSVICANVLEHIKDDVRFLKMLLSRLRPGGHLVVLVPAHQRLYSKYDLEAGHYRRYTRPSLRHALETAGARIDRLFSFNFIGALGWWWAFKLKGSREIDETRTRQMLQTYRNVVLPVSKIIERFVPMPFGLSVVGCCRNGDPSE